MANQVRSKPARLPARRAVRVCYGGNGSASTDSARYLSGLTPGLVPLRILLYPRTSLSRTPSFWRLDSSRSLVKLRLLDRGATVMPSRPFRYRFVANGLVHVRLRGRLQLRQATRGLASRQSGREIDHDARKSLGSGAHASPSNGARCDRGRASTHHRSGGSRIGHVVTEPRHTVPVRDRCLGGSFCQRIWVPGNTARSGRHRGMWKFRVRGDGSNPRGLARDDRNARRQRVRARHRRRIRALFRADMGSATRSDPSRATSTSVVYENHRAAL